MLFDPGICLHRRPLSRCGCSTEIRQSAFTASRPNCIFTWHHRPPRPKAFGYPWLVEGWAGAKISPICQHPGPFSSSTCSCMTSERWSFSNNRFTCSSGPHFLLTASHSSRDAHPFTPVVRLKRHMEIFFTFPNRSIHGPAQTKACMHHAGNKPLRPHRSQVQPDWGTSEP